MALLRTKEQIQQGWRTWFDGYAEDQGMSADTKANTYVELSREIAWMIINDNLAEDIPRRIGKITTLQQMNVDPATMDPYWQARLALFEYMLS